MHKNKAVNDINIPKRAYRGLCTEDSWSNTAEGSSSTKFVIDQRINLKSTYVESGKQI